MGIETYSFLITLIWVWRSQLNANIVNPERMMKISQL